MMLFQRRNELAHVAFGDLSADFELVADFIDDYRFGGSVLKKFEDPRRDEVEIEHLALPDVQGDGSVLAMGAANAF